MADISSIIILSSITKNLVNETVKLTLIKI